MLAERFANAIAARGKEGVGHTAANCEGINLVDKVFEKIDLGADLRPADHSQNWAVRRAECGIQRFQLSFH